jgi:hypothetical protein
MKTKNLWLWLIGLLMVPLAVLAQTNTPPVLPADLPQSVSQFWDYGISLVTPLIVMGVYKLVPKIPKWVLPTITPFVGIGLGLAVNALTSANLGWVDMAKAGALAVFIREVINQAVTKNMATPAPKPPTP